MRTWIRRYFGITDLETHMATWLDTLHALAAQTTAASAAQVVSFTNLQNGLNRQEQQIAELRAQLRNATEVTPEMQAKVDEISLTLADMKSAADTADNGYEPAPVEPEQPPVEPVEDDSDPEQPVENPDVPAEPTEPATETGRR
jgi:hypothetical protein